MMLEPIIKCDYGQLADKVMLEPDFFTGFEPANRHEIVAEEAKYYHGITEPYSVDMKLNKWYEEFNSFDGEKVKIKIYKPKMFTRDLPVFVFFHGGGFITCSVETHDFVPSYIAANANVIAFSVEYRLAPEYKFPIGLRDSFEAVKWVKSNASRFGADAEKISLGGDSSGGNFTAALSLIARDEGFKLDKQVLIYPATDLANIYPKKSATIYTMVGTSENGKKKNSTLDNYVDSPELIRNKLVTPLIEEDLSGLPKALFIEAECDALVDDGLMYAKRLQDAGVSVEAYIFKGMPHAFILRTYEETFEALDKICAFLRT
jgi:acetyl esterase